MQQLFLLCRMKRKIYPAYSVMQVPYSICIVNEVVTNKSRSPISGSGFYLQ